MVNNRKIGKWHEQTVHKKENSSSHSKMKRHPGRLAQDGEVEGRGLTLSYVNTRITTNCWTAIDKKLEPTKKDILHPKAKKKPQQGGRRGEIAIKSNLIPVRWVTHKLENNYTTEVFPLEWKFWAPRQASQPGGLATGGGAPREFSLEGQRGWFF